MATRSCASEGTWSGYSVSVRVGVGVRVRARFGVRVVVRVGVRVWVMVGVMLGVGLRERGHLGGDVGEIWARYGRDVREIWARSRVARPPLTTDY